MTALGKEMLEYQRAVLELPRFVLSGITIFATASSFFIRDLNEENLFSRALLVLYIVGMIFTFFSFVFGFRIISSIISIMRDAEGNEIAKKNMKYITSGTYIIFSWISALCLCFWVLCLFFLAVLK